MSPHEFIENLSRHYAKRHASDDHARLWMREMIELVIGTEARVLRRAYEIIRDEHDERAFPLPATIKTAIRTAGERMYPEHRPENSQWRPQSAVPRAPDSPEWVAICKSAREWQNQIIAEYGSWANHWRATRHLRGHGGSPKPYVEPKPAPVANRDHFANRPGWKAGSLSEHEQQRAIENMKRLTGERDES